MPSLPTQLFDYSLPENLIAQTPAARRDQSRLLVVDRASRTIAHCVFADLPRFLRSGDTLFRNNAAVLPARLHAQRPSGGQVECLLLRAFENEIKERAGAAGQTSSASKETPTLLLRGARAGGQFWLCLVRPGKKLPVGATFAHADGAFTGEIIAKESDGSVLVRFTTRDDKPITAVANRLGDVPLPPYIHRKDSSPRHDAERAQDLERYQTVYADRARQVAVAAPTAGLHFTPELLTSLAAGGVKSADITLHVGLGTFKPITTETVDAHVIHRELYEIPAAAQRALIPPLAGRRVAVGTTTVRTIEDFLATQHARTAPVAPDGAAYLAEASIFIYPPFQFRGVDALITNFHQPRSTLLCLVAAFLAPGSTAGIAWLREIYAEAIAREYRFFSYGDAMLVI